MSARTEPVALSAALASFTERWGPRIVTAVNDYDVR
ncbi:cupin, partial [Streptomyces anthocyanicus]